ncbi:MAG: peptide chain release factor N(5)-glutamine methyltransferase [Acidimicrobiales bacterium]
MTVPGPANGETRILHPERASEASERSERSSLQESVAARLGSDREARWILEHADGDQDLALALTDRRAGGEPLQYVLGRWPFRTLELTVDRRVLIPRPETEQVVEVALAALAALVARAAREAGAGPGGAVGRPAAGPVCVDLGTGSGAIALSLAAEGGAQFPDLQVWATDRSAEALAVAAGNLTELGRVDRDAASRVHLSEGSWFDALPAGLVGSVDLVVSNPPYVAEEDYDRLDPVVRDWEPRGALVAERGSDGVTGMAAIELIVAGARRWLRPTGLLVIEIDPSQAAAASAAGRRAGFDHVRVERDLAGRLRVFVAR